MTLVKNLTKTFIAGLALILIVNQSAFADGGFPVRPGRLLLAPAVSYFFANSAWDTTGMPAKRYPNNGKYQSMGVTLYGEYGISREWAVAVTVPYVYNIYSQT